MNPSAKKAVIILSGGLDSTTCMGIARDRGYELYPLTFDYGQRHRIELDNARKVAEHYGVSGRHKVVKLDFLREIGGSALTDDSIDVPDMTAPGAADTAASEIPITYVPGRNLMFLSIATSYAEVLAAEAIFIGVNALDYSGYPDCRPEFIAKVEDVIKYATKIGVEGKPISIETPLVNWTKADIIREGMRLGVPYELTTSCYNGREAACGVCDSCRLRLKGFAEAGCRDPISYETR
ncbi:7-cyano-7-deazaguanine synthase [Gordoniibacillus kamchatkensis]|uniref:7-cyano-7-deazaguanine synthase n=1 Tax=Gordoniibacillus kamchatkensis TaxID=1590651 RepID=A0ABR5AB85_9BACL|nr:7-cyano-7-deazaguanine synthase QueC [Paenibacillus sp. VKM B-2647]KIL38241.1 7-cyano-7-deazaguanine synthase [Paenibacillus sp. VKM B-2647]